MTSAFVKSSKMSSFKLFHGLPLPPPGKYRIGTSKIIAGFN
jgi:hypothetical protein